MIFKVRPITIEAVRWTGYNAIDVIELVNISNIIWGNNSFLHIKTWEGTKKVEVGDYIVKYPNGKYDVYNQTQFEKMYEQEGGLLCR